MTVRRCAISGTSGFIGSALAAALRGRGDEVIPIVRRPPRAGEIGLDVAAATLDCSMIEGAHIGSLDVVYHLGGAPLIPRRWNASTRDRLRSSRISSTDLLAREIAAATTRPTTFVTMSAVGFYGSRGDEVLTELSSAGTGFLAELCRAWEEAASPAASAGVRVVHARTGIVIDRRGGIVARLAPLFSLGLGGKLGDGTQWMSPIALHDEVRALLYIADERAITGPCNLTAPTPIRNAQFTSVLAKHFHRPAPLSLPAAALRMLLGETPAEDLALASQRAIPSVLANTDFKFHFRDLRKMLES